MTTYFLLVWEFLKTGLFSVGGGYATIPFLNAMADNYPWFDRDTVANMIAISESTPGPIGINMATFAGYKAAGIGGGIAASLALVLPSAIIVSAVSGLLNGINENRRVKAAFYGLRPAVAALIASAAAGIVTASVIDTSLLSDFTQAVNIKQVILFSLLFAFTRFYKKTKPVFLIAAAAVIGAVFKV